MLQRSWELVIRQKAVKRMVDRAYIISRTLENKIAIAENNDQNTLIVTIDVLKEILALLKEQEAVEPIPPKDESDLWRCGNCNHQLFRCTHQMYCEMCGKSVKWE